MNIIASNECIRLRELNEADIPDMVKYGNNINVSKNLRDGFPSPYTTKDAEAFLDILSKRKPMSTYAIDYKEQYVGNIGLVLGDDVYRKSAELGYFIGEPFWNKGITTEAVNLITEYGFKQFDIVKIYSCVFGYNMASQRVMEKCGYTKEAVLRKAIYKNGAYTDEIRYAMIL